jgi:signal peptidase I
LSKIVFPVAEGTRLELDLLGVLLAIVAAVHTYRVALAWESSAMRPAYARWYGMLGVAAAIVIFGFFVRAFGIEPFRLPSTAMAPGLPSGTFVVVRKWGYGHYGTFGIDALRTSLSAPLARGDVVVFDYPVRPEVTFIKRLIGLPGDTIEYRERRLRINGTAVPATNKGMAIADTRGGTLLKRMTERLGDAEFDVLVDDRLPPVNTGGVRNFPMRDLCRHDAEGFACTIPAGHYFMMGDNRDNSDDSRYWGFVPESLIVGKVVATFLPK